MMVLFSIRTAVVPLVVVGLAVLFSSSLSATSAFSLVSSPPSSLLYIRHHRYRSSSSLLRLRLASIPQQQEENTKQVNHHNDENENDDEVLASLTPELNKLTSAFRDIGDDKLRYKQLLYMANQLPPLPSPETTMIPQNKVPGCLSTVYVDATARLQRLDNVNEQQQKYVVDFVGDSDGLLTKGLVALLVRGLSGCTADEIQQVDPAFIQRAQIAQSLTPGRNNGFLNMLKVMKQKAIDVTEEAKEQQSKSSSNDKQSLLLQDDSDDTTTDSAGNDTSMTSTSIATTSTGTEQQVQEQQRRPIYTSMMESLQKLQPTTVELVDTSYQHAGHAGVVRDGMDGSGSGETHFDLVIVAEAFEGLNLVKRHQLIYMILAKEMPQIHALSIKANTPNEV